MAKEINEKTFELNITNELLNLSKSFIWYLEPFHWFHFPPMRNRDIISQFMKQATFFAEGLTQEEESNPLTGGYDVSINYNNPNGLEGRMMFLQYKAGIRLLYSNRRDSNFYRQTARNEGRSSVHALFTFNDAAEGTQHSTLRNLANSTNINPNSVFYVFPRITEKSDFKSKIGNLINHSSFVPVLEIDYQASKQTPPISIIDGFSHKYRTSYDGLKSEVNFFFFFFFYDNRIITEIISELICVQIERFAKILMKQSNSDLEIFLDALSESFNQFVEYELKLYPTRDVINTKVNVYIRNIRQDYITNKKIPQAPSEYSTIVPEEGLKLKLNVKDDFSKINYQLF